MREKERAKADVNQGHMCQKQYEILPDSLEIT